MGIEVAAFAPRALSSEVCGFRNAGHFFSYEGDAPSGHHLGLGIGGRSVGVVGAALAFEVGPAVVCARPVVGALGLKLFKDAQASIRVASTEKCSSDTQPLACASHTNSAKKKVGRLVLEQARLVLRKRRMVEHRLVRVEVEEPAEQHIVLQALARLLLRADRVERHQHLRQQQPLRRNRWAALLRITLLKVFVPPLPTPPRAYA